MTTIRGKSGEIRAYILKHVRDQHLGNKVAERFGITKQAASKHLRAMVLEGSLRSTGETRNRIYRLAPTKTVSFSYEIAEGLAEDAIWRNDIEPTIGTLPDNVRGIWNYAFTEMFNNAIDHSDGKKIVVHVVKTAVDTELMVSDDGVGIFRKIQDALKLPDQKQAIFELSKGKLTTDSRKHSGQGIFFTSRMVDGFNILSEGTYFSHELGREEDWMLDVARGRGGTAVFLRVNNHTTRNVKEVYAKWSVGGSFSFNKTVVPVNLAKYGTDQLVSRSQAKRVLSRVEQFSQVIFDFTDVEMIGQPFADEIFRVFALAHPNVRLIPSHANADIRKMVTAAIKEGRPGFKGHLDQDSTTAQ